MGPRVKKSLRLGGIVVLALGVGALTSFFALTRTRVGQGLVLANVLQRVEGAVNGRIVVSGIHSTGLHKGATLLGVSVGAPDGSRLVAADSLQAEDSVRGRRAGRVPRGGCSCRVRCRGVGAGCAA